MKISVISSERLDKVMKLLGSAESNIDEGNHAEACAEVGKAIDILDGHTAKVIL